MSVSERLKAAGVNLPEPRAPVANYVPFVITGKLLFISGQVSAGPDGLIKGRLGEDMTLEQGQAGGAHLRHQPDRADEGGAGRSRTREARREARRLRQRGEGLCRYSRRW